MTSEPKPTPIPVDLAATIDEQTNLCFGCGPHNPHGLQLRFVFDDQDPEVLTAIAPVNLSNHFEGAPGFIHGGIIATLLDEAMSKLNRPLEALAMTRHMEVDYRLPAPTNTTLTLTGRHLRREGRKLFHTAELTDQQGNTLATGKALFIALDPAVVAAHLANRGR